MIRENKLSPSILAADFANLGDNIIRADKAGADYIHVDVMDGLFVPSISFGMPVIDSIRKSTEKIFDVHLMIKEPIRYIEEFAKIGADIITVHVEACEDVHATIRKIKECGKKAGITLNPATPVSAIEEFLDEVDMVLVMSVNPGFGGQKYIPDSTNKIALVKELRDDNNYDFDIEVDGGIGIGNLKEVLDAGANVIVAGSAVFRGNIEENVAAFKKLMQQH